MLKTYFNSIVFILLALFWSASFLGIKISIAYFPPFFSAALRIAISLFFLEIWRRFTHKPLAVPFSVCWPLWLTGIIGLGLPLALLFYGEKFVTPALASIINSTSGIWALLLGIAFFRQQQSFSWQKFIGLVIGLAGIMVIFWPTLTSNHMHSTAIGILSVLGMAISYAVGALLNQHWINNKLHPPFLATLWHQQLACILFLLLISAWLEPWSGITAHWTEPKVWLALLYLGLFSTALAWAMYYYLIQVWDAVRASSVMYLVPLLAIFWDFLFLHTTPHLSELAGAGLILGGVILIQWPEEQESSSRVKKP